MTSWIDSMYPDDETVHSSNLSSNGETDSVSNNGDRLGQRKVNSAGRMNGNRLVKSASGDEDTYDSMSDMSASLEQSRNKSKYYHLSTAFNFTKKHSDSTTPPSSEYSSESSTSPSPAPTPEYSNQEKPWVTVKKREIEASEEIDRYLLSNPEQDSLVEYLSDDQSGVRLANGSCSVSTLSVRSVDGGGDEPGTDVKKELYSLKSKLQHLGFKGPSEKKRGKRADKKKSRQLDTEGNNDTKIDGVYEIVLGEDGADDASNVSSVKLNKEPTDRSAKLIKKEDDAMVSNDMTDCCFGGDLPIPSIFSDNDEQVKNVAPVNHVAFAKVPEVLEETEYNCTHAIESNSIQVASAAVLSLLNSANSSSQEASTAKQDMDLVQDSSVKDSPTTDTNLVKAKIPGDALPLVHAPSEEIRADKAKSLWLDQSKDESDNAEHQKSPAITTGPIQETWGTMPTIEEQGAMEPSSDEPNSNGEIACINENTSSGKEWISSNEAGLYEEPDTTIPVEEVVADMLDDGSIVVSLFTTDLEDRSIKQLGEETRDAFAGDVEQAMPSVEVSHGEVPEFVDVSEESNKVEDGTVKMKDDAILQGDATLQDNQEDTISFTKFCEDLEQEQPSTAIEAVHEVSLPHFRDFNLDKRRDRIELVDLESGDESVEKNSRDGDGEPRDQRRSEANITSGDDSGHVEKGVAGVVRRQELRRLCWRVSILGLVLIILLSVLIGILRTDRDSDRKESMVVNSSPTSYPTTVIVVTKPPAEIPVPATQVPIASSPVPATPAPTELDSAVEDECRNRIITDDVCYPQSSPFFISFNNCEPLGDDWIGVYPSGADPLNLDEPIFWVWACGDQDCFEEILSDTYPLNFSLPPGSYVAYLARQGNGFPPYKAYATSDEFFVVGPGEFC